jgi:Ca2+-transporting ATPase
MNTSTTEVTDAWWSLSADDLARRLNSNPRRGLSPDEVEEHRARYGANELAGVRPSSLWKLAWDSVRSPMLLLLLAIAGISLLLGQLREAFVMVFVVAMYIAVHVLNSARADRTMAKLRELQTPTTTVLRDGRRQEIPVSDVVVGDIVLLQSGTRVAADARLITSAGLLVNEAPLTGEAAPVIKDAEARVRPTAPLAERPTAVFAGTTVLDGVGTAIVVAVGSQTELGRVARLTTGVVSMPTPLQRQMSELARTLAVFAVGVSFLIPLIGLIRGYDLHQMILTWLSLTFLMVPGQPPIIISMALALASLELARRSVIVRRLQGAETMGAVMVILSDKTGTMTENRMTLSAIILGDGQIVEAENRRGDREPVWRRFLAQALLAIPEITNDPTDLAIVEAARQERVQPLEKGRLVRLVGFARGKVYRSLTYERDGRCWTYVTGSPSFVADRSTSRMDVEAPVPWSNAERSQVLKHVEKLAAEGKRITAYGHQEDAAGSGEPRNLVFVGAAVITDPIRPGVFEAIKRLRTAGVRTAMVTGDNPATAAFVARQVGLVGTEPLTGSDLDRMSDRELEAAVRRVSVFARTVPEQKLRLVKVFERLGNVVGVTGDGVNDAPALQAAQVGIAMGQRGTDVAKEAADLVLTDDDFSHLPDAVAIGRKAYDNFRKGITYYLSAKAILLAIFVVPLLVGVPFPLAPIQIIFTELLMDLASSTIFVSEPAEPNVMRRPPRRPGRFLTKAVGLRILRNMLGLTVVILAVYLGSLAWGYGVDNARTAAFATWLLGHIVLAMNLKQEEVPLRTQGLLANRFAAGWLTGMVVLVLAMTTIPAVQAVLNTTALSGPQWLAVVVGAILASSWIELTKRP